jgi:hypothetical protein
MFVEKYTNYKKNWWNIFANLTIVLKFGKILSKKKENFEFWMKSSFKIFFKDFLKIILRSKFWNNSPLEKNP